MYLSDCPIDTHYNGPPDKPLTLVGIANTAPLIRNFTPHHLQTFTQRRRQRIGTGSPHSNGSVDGANTVLAVQGLMKVSRGGNSSQQLLCPEEEILRGRQHLRGELERSPRGS